MRAAIVGGIIAIFSLAAYGIVQAGWWPRSRLGLQAAQVQAPEVQAPQVEVPQVVASVPVAPLDEDGLRRVVASGLTAGWHTVPDRFSLVGGQSLGLMLGPVLRLLGVDEDGLATFDRGATGTSAGPMRVVREGPYAVPSVTCVGPDASPAALWNAALDEAAEGAARIIRTTEVEAGPADELVLTGGWAHLAGLRSRKRRVLSRARWPEVVEAGARGAALFGGCAAGLFSGPGAFPKPQDLAWAEPA